MSEEFHFINDSDLFSECKNCPLVQKVRLIMAQKPSGLVTQEALGLEFDTGAIRIKCRRIGLAILGMDRILMTIQNNRMADGGVSMNQIQVKDATKICPGRNSGKR